MAVLCKAAFRHLNYIRNCRLFPPLPHCTLLNGYTTTVFYYCPKDSHNCIFYIDECMRALSSNCSKDSIYKSSIYRTRVLVHNLELFLYFKRSTHLLLTHMKDQQIWVKETWRKQSSKIFRIYYKYNWYSTDLISFIHTFIQQNV